MFPSTLAQIDEGLRAVMGDLDPAVMHGSDAVAALERFSTIEKMAATGRMLMGKRVAETNAWKASGKPTAESFLASIAGCSLAEAHRMLGTAKKLGRLPETEKAARRGELSTGQAGDIADAAAVDPTAEQSLLDLSKQGSASELREESRKRRHAAAENDERRHARLRNQRALRTWTDDDGAARLSWTHLPEAGAEVNTILRDYIDDQFADARRTGRRERREAYAADTFVEALRDAAAFRRGETIDDEPATDATDATDADGTDDTNGSVDATHANEPPGIDVDDAAGAPHDARSQPDHVDDLTGAAVRNGPFGSTAPTCDRDSGSPDVSPPDRATGRRRTTRRRGADAKVIVVIDHAALLRGHTEAGETCTIAGVGAVPVASVRALLDDAFLAAVIRKGHDVTTVAHLGRSPNAYQQTAMQAEGVECSTLGCPNRWRLERDHRVPHRASGHTTLAELDWSCGHCHDRKTYFGDMLAPGHGKRPLLTLDQQQQWNHDHPDDPCDPPQTSYPNRPTARPDTRTATPGRPGAATPEPRALTLDL